MAKALVSRQTFGIAPRYPILAVLALVALSLSWTGCGLRGGNSSPNDPEPTGTIVAQASWTSLGGQTVTGTVVVYSSSSGVYTFRLNGLVAPEESGLQLYATSATSVTYFLGNLRASSGNQNYTIEPGVLSWSQVVLHSATQNQNYAQALF